MYNFHFKKIATWWCSAFILSLACSPSFACEHTPYFNTEVEATAHVTTGQPVEIGMIMNAIHFDNLPVLKVLNHNNSFSLDKYPVEIGWLTTPLDDAISRNATTIIHYLIKEKGIKPTSAHVHLAVNGFHRESLKALLQYPVDIQGKDRRGLTPTQVARAREDVDTLKILQEFQARSANK